MRARTLLLGLAVLAPACGGGEPVRGAGHNVLLISLDSTRRDLLTLYGRTPALAPDESTCPNLEALASGGVVLEDAYSTTSWTLPSHMSILTGLPEVVHAVDIDNHHPSDEVTFLQEHLRAAGYRTAGFFTGPYLDPVFGFDRGFDRYESAYGPELGAAARDLEQARRNLDAARENGNADVISAAQARYTNANRQVEALSHRDRSSATVTDAALAELESMAADEEPFFLFVHYFDPHYDYAPPEELARRFDPDWDGSVPIHSFLGNPNISTFDPATGERERVASDRTMAHVQGMYEGELAWTDQEIGRLLDRLETLGLADDTLVIVTADHGDEFFEHGGLGHRSTLYEEQVRVPMILRLPGKVPAGERKDGIVSTIDVVPTVLELLELRLPELCAGTSMMPVVRGEGADGRSAFGRFLAMRSEDFHLMGGVLKGQSATLMETYREGRIKVMRTVRFPIERKGPNIPEQVHHEMLRRRLEAQRSEELVWIDVEEHPDEPDVAWSSDFSDPEARAALRAFHDRYEELLALRSESVLVEDDEDLAGMLSALGYADDGGAAPSDTFALPPPGKAVLGD